MSEFINTIDVLGDDAVIDSIINRTITEFKDNMVTIVEQYAFYKCTALTDVGVLNATTIKTNSFAYCSSLERVELPQVTAFTGGGQFQDCTALKKVKLPALNYASTGYEFRNCSSLRILDTLGAWNISSNTFRGCSSLIALIQRGEKIPTLKSNTAFNGTPIASGAGYIYVPRALVDSYKAATNWSAYATQFRALEDYTVDGTTTGDLDETKI